MTAVITRLKQPRLNPMLTSSPRRAVDSHWEGELKGTHGAASECTICIKARIGLAADLLEGDGRATNFPSDYGNGDFTVSGARLAGDVTFQLYFAASCFARAPFCASGSLSTDENEITGTWDVGCQNPNTCGCNGGGGEFRLRRVPAE